MPADSLAQWSGVIADHCDPGWLEPGWQYGEPRQGTMTRIW